LVVVTDWQLPQPEWKGWAFSAWAIEREAGVPVIAVSRTAPLAGDSEALPERLIDRDNATMAAMEVREVSARVSG
jgi:hypothetical protein